MHSDFSLNTIRKGKTYDVLVLSIQGGNGNVTKVLEKRDISKKRKEKEETRVAVGAHAYRRTKND